MAFQKILLIDDDIDDQEIFLLAIEMISPTANCVCFSSAADALDKLSSNLIRPEAIFLDLNMPVMNGHEFLIRIKKDKNLSDIPVIIFSTSSDPKIIQLTKDLGALDFITKPSNVDKLVELLKPSIG